MSEGNGEYPTTLGADASFKGELRFEKGVRLLGQFEGEVVSEGDLVVAEGATLEGQVNASSISISGQVKGNLSANTKIQLTSSGRLEGDISTSRLEVADGAVLIGRCMVGAKPNTPPRAGATLRPSVPEPQRHQPTPQGPPPAVAPVTPPPIKR
jgi:cytoskeletal protein CcmA (bactofilin family)